MEMTKVSKRKAKKIKLIIQTRPDYKDVKDFKKLKKFTKSNKKESVRKRDWHDTFEDDEDSTDLRSFHKIRKMKDRYKPDSLLKKGNKSATRVSSSERKTFSRIDPGVGRHKEKGIVANLDLLVVVVSVKNPPLRPGLIDRFLVISEQNGFDVLICINKIDLVETNAEYKDDWRIYSDLGYNLLLTSVEHNIGLEDLKTHLKDRRSLFIGHSGVGKSSLVNALDPSLKLRVGHVSSSSKKGRHTTTSKKLLEFSFGGEVIDAPGIKQLGIKDISKTDLADLFREIRGKANGCRFSNCSHINEKSCAVLEAVKTGAITQKRYNSFLRIYRSLP